MRVFTSNWSRLTVTALFAGLIVAGNNFSQGWQNPNPRLRANAIAPLDEVDPDEQVIRAPGEVTLPKCSVKLLDSVTLASDRPGLISFVEPKEGDDVRKDQEIVFLKDEILKAIYNVAKRKSENTVNQRFADKSAAVAKAEWEKMQESNRKVPGSIPSTEVDRARLNYEKGLLQGEQADRHGRNGKSSRRTEDLPH